MQENKYKNCKWDCVSLNTVNDVLDKVGELSRNRDRWGFRGQPGEFGNLTPSLERIFNNVEFTDSYEKRKTIIRLENASAELFRRTLIANITDKVERDQVDFIVSLGLLQHYDGATRLLDWSFSPYTALYFAVSGNEDEGGEIWSFDYDQYERTAPHQWGKYPAMKNNDWSKAFDINSGDDWFVCEFVIGDKFPRLYAQDGFFSMTSQFGRDHAEMIAEILQDKDTFRLYLINKKCKSSLLRYLREELNIWHGAIYPDITGAGGGIKELLTNEASIMRKNKLIKIDHLRSVYVKKHIPKSNRGYF